MKSLIPACTSIPTRIEQSFKTNRKNQKIIDLTLYQGERRKALENKELGKFSVVDLPDGEKGQVKVIVTIVIDTDNRMHVTAQ